MASDERSLREYAMTHQLFLNSKKHITKRSKTIFDDLQKSPYFPPTATLKDPEGVPTLVIPEPILPPETDLKKDNLGDLATLAIGLEEQDDWMTLAMDASFQNLRFSGVIGKFELPALRTDPRHDLKALAKDVWETKQYDFFRRPNPLVLEPVDEKKGEGLALPSSAVHFHDQLARGAEPDEIDYDEEDLAYVAEAVHETYTDEDLQNLIQLEMPTRQRPQSMSPVLIPRSPDLTPDDISEPIAKARMIQLSSDPDSLMAEDLNSAGKMMDYMYEHECLPDMTMDSIEDLFDPPESESPPTGQRLEDLKMEPPILCKSDEVSTSTQFEEACRAHIRGMSELGQAAVVMTEDLAEDYDDFEGDLTELLQSKAEEITRKSEQEQIYEADATARLEVPVVDFTIPDPDWQQSGATQDASQMYLWIRRHLKDQFNAALWPKTWSEREFMWHLMPGSLGGVNTEESVGDKTLYKKLMECPAIDMASSAGYIKKRSGLKVLALGDDEELPVPSSGDEPWSMEHEPELGVLEAIRKRKSAGPLETGGIAASPRINNKSRRITNRKTTNFGHDSLLFGDNDPDAPRKLLSSFLELQAPKKSHFETASHFFPTPERTAASRPVLRTKTNTAQSPAKAPDPPPKPVFKRIVPPCPTIEPLAGLTKIVISTTVARNIMNALTRNLPGVDLIDRDFTKLSTTSLAPADNKSTVSISPFEADITPSPATGIITTNVLKISQKASVGSTSQLSEIRQRVAKVALLYEHLAILVSEGSTQAEEHVGQLSKANAEAYTSFVAFASAISISTGCSIRVIYVGGGLKTLENWTCALVSIHAKETSSELDLRGILIQDETDWELFLRRAGFNVYAAQVIICLCKGACAAGANGHEAPLIWFLKMSPEERVQYLARHLGGGADEEKGRNVLNRVSARLNRVVDGARKTANPCAAAALSRSDGI
ncbi:hypothetical protein CkaCkLH20_10243 [Colletotrichum karsti]|uniref:Uncharacterized protein n=1 Tax=Colletotrichum karsti TaxID=1095194 RepID=A0A9P6LGP7_9PEZI|nr:uncharacterized protein CkaCkLH20_10243 [Colletotrichum karsti]KAF9872416.1 hypothetical protein CkaCkLH20_10243 [Colletotrichum karsti]